MRTCFVFFLISFLAISCAAQNDSSLIELKYGVYIKKINPNFKDGVFNAEFYWWVIFENDSAKTGVSNEEIMNLEYVNGFESEVGKFSQEIQEIKSVGKNVFYYTGFHQGAFYFNPDFTNYPFDKQILNIAIENSILTKDRLQIIADTGSYIASHQPANFWAMSTDLINQKNVSFKFLNTLIYSSEGVYNSNFGDPSFQPKSVYSRQNTTITINRSFLPYISKLLIPLLIILLLVYFVFFLPAEKIDIAAGLTVTSLLSAIAFQLSISNELPEIGYIIYIDKVFYTCYFLIAISMAESLITYYLDASGEEKKIKAAHRIDYAFRFIFPLVFFIACYVFAT
jgi:hypothetical protein